MAEQYPYEFAEPVAQFLDREQSMKAEQTFKNRRSDLRHFSAWIDDRGLGDPTRVAVPDIDDYLASLGKKYAPGTVKARYDSLSLLYDYLTSRNHYEENPMGDEGALPRSKYRTIMSSDTRKSEATRDELPSITPEEKEKLIEHRPAPKLRNELVLRLLWQTAVRQHELTGIRIEDVDRESRSIRIRSDKTHENRLVGYWSNTGLLLEQWLDHGRRASYPHAKDSKYLLVSDQSPRMKRKPSKIIKRAAENAGIQKELYEDAAGQTRWKITAHSFRHGSAKYHLNNGMDVEKLRRYLGHENLETTKQYLRTDEDAILEAAHAVGASSEG